MSRLLCFGDCVLMLAGNRKIKKKYRTPMCATQIRKPNQGYVDGLKIYLTLFFTAPLNWRTFAARLKFIYGNQKYSYYCPC